MVEEPGDFGIDLIGSLAQIPGAASTLWCFPGGPRLLPVWCLWIVAGAPLGGPSCNGIPTPLVPEFLQFLPKLLSNLVSRLPPGLEPFFLRTPKMGSYPGTHRFGFAARGDTLLDRGPID